MSGEKSDQPRVVILDGNTYGNNVDIDKIASCGKVNVYDSSKPSEVYKRIKYADVVITNKARISKNDIKRSKNLDLIIVAASVIETVDVQAANKHNVKVKCASNYAVSSVTQLTYSLILAIMSKLEYYSKYVETGSYSRQSSFSHIGEGFHELNNKIVGVIGLGSIGERVASVASSFGAEAIYYSTTGNNNNPDYRRMPLVPLLNHSDVVTIHCEYNSNTKKLICIEEMREMKDSSILINTARGGIVDEHDLALAIDDEIISGAGVDVFEEEPIRADNPLMNVVERDRVILTPHCGWGSDEAGKELTNTIISTLKHYL